MANEEPTFPTIEDNEDDEPTPAVAEDVVTPEEAPARVLHGRPRGIGGKKPGKTGAGFAGVPSRIDPRLKRTWENKEADFMWEEMQPALKAASATPYDIDMRVIKMDPPPQHTLPGAIPGAAVAGSSSESPGEALCRVIDDNYHMPTMRSQATYDIVFTWKRDGSIWGRGRLTRPGQEEITAVRAAQQRNRNHQSPPAPGSYLPGMGAPPPAPSPYGQQPPPGYYPPPPPYAAGYGAPQPPQVPQSNPSHDALLQHVIAQNQALMAWMQKQGMQPPPGLAAPPPPPPQPVYQPPPQAPTGLGAIDELDRLVTAMDCLRNVGDRINGVLGRTVVEPGMGNPAPAVEDEPEKEEGPRLSFDVLAIPETTLKMAKDWKTGDVDWANTAFVNLDSEIGKKLVGLAGELVQTITKMAGVKKDGTVIPGGHVPAQLPQGTNGVGVAGPPAGWKP